MEIVRFETARDVAIRAADEVAEAVERDPGAVLVLPAGATPMPLYAELVERCHRRRMDLGRARFFQLDELVGLGPADPGSFHRFLRRHLLDPLNRSGTDLYLLDGSAADPAAEIERHRGLLERLGPPALVLLGLGRNGHVGFNEPGTPEGAPARVVELAAATVEAQKARLPDGSPPERGITLGLRELRAARRIRIVVTGAAKAPALGRLLRGDRSPDLPASLLGPHPDLAVLADAAACGPLAS